MSGVVSSARGLLPVKRDLNTTAHPKTGGTARLQDPKGYLEGCRAPMGYSVQDPKGDKATVHPSQGWEDGEGGWEGSAPCSASSPKSLRDNSGVCSPPSNGRTQHRCHILGVCKTRRETMSDSEFQHISIIVSQAVIKHRHINAHTALLQPPPPPPSAPQSNLSPFPAHKEAATKGHGRVGIENGKHKRNPLCS